MNKLNKEKIFKELKLNGYTILENYFDLNEIMEIKESLRETLNYIHKSDEKDLVNKYYEIKKFNSKLKGNWYDIAPYNICILNLLHKKELIELMKEYFETSVIFSGRPAIHAHDDTNANLLLPHQETRQFSVDNMVFWSPLDDTNDENGGLTIYEGSQNHGYFEHSIDAPKDKDVWTKEYTHISDKIVSKFKKKNLNVKAGSVVLMKSSMVHCGYKTKKKNFVRITITERFNPLRKLPFLQDEKISNDFPGPKSIQIPYEGVDYNKIPD